MPNRECANSGRLMIFLIRCSRAGGNCADTGRLESPARINDVQIARIRKASFLFMGCTSSDLQICTEPRVGQQARCEERQIHGGTTHLFELFSSESTGLAPAANMMNAQSVNSLAVFPGHSQGFCPTRWPAVRSSWWCAQ